ncbi:hypothetical protein MMC17_009477 [Xylographa soralifera]|nr:hypothetical protein [Xylographa soralifera]
MSTLASGSHPKLRVDKDYDFAEAAKRLQKSPNLTDEVTIAFENLLSVIRHEPGPYVDQKSLSESDLAVLKEFEPGKNNATYSDNESDQSFEDAEEGFPCQDYWAHWLLPCHDRFRCPIWIEYEERQVEELDVSDMTRAYMAFSAQARTTLDILQESDLTPVTTEAQIEEKRERLRALIGIRDRMVYAMTELEAIKERARTRRFIWEALAGMPWYPAYVIAEMIFQECLANMPWQFPVFVLWQMWE